ncbi:MULTISPECIES: energy-coupled thiamine transporter ThiT [Alteribacter]|uniref:Energy-coupled thiamine transporter ThiT n=1 Tax=Alteribacter keqinensis TaxID=2483800 RepID=A0A3M7TWG7_9BACI|nr:MULTISPECIES: energy-coupled thiamine transporter ThiT [Alteribacter]MBM7094126.1 energy-coupled thiamine transporter ThiT [Alteribacter salitolerans]RNA69641.1 energy-coupled thiamine transporter ThiT [Alteribacter keqinensis]
MNNRSKVTVMAEVALMGAIGFLLDFLSFGFAWLQGGSISLMMLPIFIMAFRRGLKAGLATGLIVGLLNLSFNPFIVHPAQAILDYPVAFLVAGFAGLFAFSEEAGAGKKMMFIVLGVFFGSLLRFTAHFLSGVIWIDVFAPDTANAYIYSFVYNITYLAPSFVICLLVMLFLVKANKKIVHANA